MIGVFFYPHVVARLKVAGLQLFQQRLFNQLEQCLISVIRREGLVPRLAAQEILLELLDLAHNSLLTVM